MDRRGEHPEGRTEESNGQQGQEWLNRRVQALITPYCRCTAAAKCAVQLRLAVAPTQAAHLCQVAEGPSLRHKG